MGAHHSINAGKAKIDVNVDLTHKLCAAFMLSPFRDTGSPLSLVIGSLYLNHPNLFGGSEKLNLFWDKGLSDSNVLVTYKRPRPEWLSQQSFVFQHSVSPEIGVHGMPIDNFSRSGSGGVNLCRLSTGLDLTEPACYNWNSKTSVKFEHVRPVNDEGRSVSRDLDGFSLTCNGNSHDSMVVLKQENRYAKAENDCFTRLNVQIEQGIPVLSKWLIFNRFKFVGTSGIKLGPCFLLTSLTGGSIVGDMAPHQAFAIGGQGSVRGYGEGAVGTGRSCLVANTDFTFPLSGAVEGSIFMDYGTDLGSGRLVPGVSSAKTSLSLGTRGMVCGHPTLLRLCREQDILRNPALRHGKPGYGIGAGYGIRIKSPVGLIQLNMAYNAYQQKTVYFDITKLTS